MYDSKNYNFMASIVTVEKNHNIRLENMILGQLKIGERQATCGGLGV